MYESPPYRKKKTPPYKSEPPWMPYSTQASAIQNDFFETLLYVYSKKLNKKTRRSVTEDYNY